MNKKVYRVKRVVEKTENELIKRTVEERAREFLDILPSQGHEVPARTWNRIVQWMVEFAAKENKPNR